MKKTSSAIFAKQKKKNFLTLCIRSGVLIATVLFYLLSSALIDLNVNQESDRQGE